jgi:hypothetical protein
MYYLPIRASDRFLVVGSDFGTGCASFCRMSQVVQYTIYIRTRSRVWMAKLFDNCYEGNDLLEAFTLMLDRIVPAKADGREPDFV